MSRRSRRLLFIAPLTLLVLLAACDRVQESASSLPSGAQTAAPSPRASGEASAPVASVAGGTQTDTSWGRIWDALPPGFPTFPGATPADPVSAEPVSATFAVEGGDPAEIATWMQAALETATFGTESLSGPLESGAFVLESLGEGDCRVESTVAPMGGLTIITVRYGAGCPSA